MHKKLILKAFEKAKIKEEKETGISASINKLSVRISDDLLNNYKCSFGDKSLRTLYKDASSRSEKKVIIKQFIVIDSLCKYLGYDDYIDFTNKNSSQKEVEELNEESIGIGWHEKVLNFIIKYKFYILLGIVFFIVITMFSVNQQRWMVWDTNQYVEVEFDAKKYNLGQLKIYKEERIQYFKRIEPNCDIQYFDESGAVRIWYGKNKTGKLEIFTAFGLHPKTGKTLKPISKYMIDKYFCSKGKKILK